MNLGKLRDQFRRAVYSDVVIVADVRFDDDGAHARGASYAMAVHAEYMLRRAGDWRTDRERSKAGSELAGRERVGSYGRIERRH